MENCDLLITQTTALLPDMTLRNDVAIVIAASHRHAGNWQAGRHHPGGCYSAAVLGAAPATDAAPVANTGNERRSA